MSPIRGRARAFAARPEISARTVLVTIFGDSIVPLGGEVWLGDLITMMRPFGFSDRLVRTSVFRLTSEGWFDTERVGRRSRYRLTDAGRLDFAAAESRIYHSARGSWDGEWTLVFLGSLGDVTGSDTATRDAVADRLVAQGFARLASGVVGWPGDGRDDVRDAVAQFDLTGAFPVATARFDDVAAFVDGGALADAFELGEADQRYRAFLDGYAWLRRAPLGALGGEDAFVVRTMVVHDLRRAALVDPRLPARLLPGDWPGFRAAELAGRTYHAVDPAAWSWLSETTGLTPDPPSRFAAT